MDMGGGARWHKEGFQEDERFWFSSDFKAAAYPGRTENSRFMNKAADGLSFSTGAFWFLLTDPDKPLFINSQPWLESLHLSAVHVLFSISFSESHHGAHIGFTPALSPSKERFLSMSDLSALRYWLRETHLASGHCCLGGNTSRFAFSCAFPITEIMGLNDLPQEALIFSIH